MKYFILSLFLTITTAGFSLHCQNQTQNDEAFELTKRENVLVPAVPSKLHQKVADYMRKEAQALVKMGYKVETERKGEVIVVTIPLTQVFKPNETELIKDSDRLLEPFLSYVKTEGRFKLLVVMHSDDTGSQAYQEELTEKRLDQVMDYFLSKARFHDQIIGYAMASDEPLRPNNTRANRELNRRLEIYIVPLDNLIQQLKKK